MIVYLSVLDSQEKKSKFEQIYLAYRKQMYYAAFQILQHDEDSEDAVHHAFIKIAENIEKFSDIECPKTRSLCVTIVENKAIDHIRKYRHESAIYEDALNGIQIPMPGDHGLADAIASLSPQYRQVILLRYVNGYGVKEIAEMLDKSLPNVEKLLWRAKQKLEIQLREMEVL